MNHPDGHFRGRVFEAPEPLSQLAWMVNPLWLFGVDLFNQRYFWEAHEVWEPLWKGLDKTEPPGMFLQALMQAAGGAIKAHAGDLDGVQAFWARSETRLVGLRGFPEPLWGLKTKKTLKQLEAFFRPAARGGELPRMDKAPILKLPM
jgi:hypothetical protein